MNSIPLHIQDQQPIGLNLGSTVFGEDDNCQYLQVSKYGRIVGNPTYPKIGGQSVCFFDDKYYISGEGYLSYTTDEGVILGSITTDGDIHGHGNAVAANSDYIVVAPSSKKWLVLYNRADLSYIRKIDYTSQNIVPYGVCFWDGYFYFLAYKTGSTSTNRIYKLTNISTGDCEEICSFQNPSIGVRQGFCILGNYAYVTYCVPNKVLKLDLATGNIDNVYYLPDGDGVWPFTELECPFVKDGDIKLQSTNYQVNSLGDSYKPTYTLIMLWDTDMLQPLNKVYDYSGFDNITINVRDESDSYPYTFNPKYDVFTGTEASVIANYHKSARIVISSSENAGTLYLTNGQYAIRGGTSPRYFGKIVLDNCNCVVVQSGASDVVLEYSTLTGITFVVQNLLYALRSKCVIHSLSAETMQEIRVVRSAFEFYNIFKLNPNFTITLTESAGSSVKIESRYLPGILRLLQLCYNSNGQYCYGKVMLLSTSFDITISRTNYLASSDKQDWEQEINNAANGEKLGEMSKTVNGNSVFGYLYYFDGSNNVELTKNNYVNFYTQTTDASF